MPKHARRTEIQNRKWLIWPATAFSSLAFGSLDLFRISNSDFGFFTRRTGCASQAMRLQVLQGNGGGTGTSCSTSFVAAAQVARPSAGQKKTAVPAKGTTAVVEDRANRAPGPRLTSRMRSRSREHNTLCIRPQAGFLTCVLPGGSFPFAGGEQWIGSLRFQI